jgi:hypothetical protein
VLTEALIARNLSIAFGHFVVIRDLALYILVFLEFLFHVRILDGFTDSLLVENVVDVTLEVDILAHAEHIDGLSLHVFAVEAHRILLSSNIRYSRPKKAVVFGAEPPIVWTPKLIVRIIYIRVLNTLAPSYLDI